MFSGIPQKNRAAAEVYFDEHLTHNDYYSESEIKPGIWIGEGLARLGLKEGGIVNREQFVSLCDNTNPNTGKLLTQRRNEDGKRRVFFDFTCSAPKSVSIMAVTMNDTRIIEAHEAAAKIALKELEQFAGARIRKDGADSDRTTGNLVGAAFTHNSSRALDPQLHTHFVLFNCTFDSKEKRWKALQTSAMFDASKYGTEVYRNELANRLRGIGYEIQKSSNGFQIKSVSKEIQRRFSKRSQERDAMIAKMERELGRKVTNNEISVAIHKTRSRKMKGISNEEVRKRQLAQIGFFEKMSLKSVLRHADGKAKPVEIPVRHDEAIFYAMAHAFERNSVVSEHDLLQAALAKGCGQMDLNQLKHDIHEKGDLVRVGDQYSSREILETELYLIRSMEDTKEAVRPINPDYVPSSKLGRDQAEAVRLILKSPDLFTGIRGLAGTGKSTALGELAFELKLAGRKAVFCAPTAAAADVLRKDGFEAVTLQKLLMDGLLRSQLYQRSVVILDEAGAVGIDDMKSLFRLAQDQGFRVVLSGDTGQHSSVARGDALRILEQHSRYAFGELTQLRRQRQADYLQVVELAANKQSEKAFLQLEQMGCVTEQTHGAIYESAARVYVDSIQKGKSALLVSPTWKEIESVTEKVRETLKAQGVLSHDDTPVSVLDSLSWTNAQKRDAGQYESGQRIIFHQRAGAFSKDETVEVVAVGKSSLRVKCADGSERSLNVGKVAGSMEVCQPRQLSIAAGDKLLLQANRKVAAGKNLINGELVTVKAIHGPNILLEDGRTLPADYRRFTHGYAVTSHSSQGKTVENVFLVASSRSFGAVNREQFYVSISRGRERCQVFTDDSELLRRRICDTHERTAAIELLDFREALRQKGFSTKNSPTRGAANHLSENLSNRRAVRPLRQLRPSRDTKISVVQRLYQMAEDFLNRVHRNNQGRNDLREDVGKRHEVRNDLLERIRQERRLRKDLRESVVGSNKSPDDLNERVRESEQSRKDLRERIKQGIRQRQGRSQSQGRGISM